MEPNSEEFITTGALLSKYWDITTKNIEAQIRVSRMVRYPPRLVW